MTIDVTPWTYNLSVGASTRLPILQSGATFAEITQRIVDQMTVLCCHRSEVGGTDFSRPVYTISIGRELFDLFFNSSDGYRAAYFRSPGTGLDANVFFMRAVSPGLLQNPLSANSGLSESHISESLVTPSAKVWVAEHGKEIDQKCAGCEGEWSSGSASPSEQPEILNTRWETTAGQKAEWGRKAPYLTKLRVMGAFLNERHHELVPHDKRFRAYEIHSFGWS